MPKRKVITTKKENKKIKGITIECTFFPYSCKSFAITLSPQSTQQELLCAILEKQLQEPQKKTELVITQLQCMKMGKLAYRFEYVYKDAKSKDTCKTHRVFQSQCIRHYPYCYLPTKQWFDSLHFVCHMPPDLLLDPTQMGEAKGEVRELLYVSLYPVLDLKVECSPEIFHFLNVVPVRTESTNITPKRKQVLTLLQTYVSHDVAMLINSYLTNDLPLLLADYCNQENKWNLLHYCVKIGVHTFHADNWDSMETCVEAILCQNLETSKDFSANGASCLLHLHVALPKPKFVHLNQCPNDWSFGWFCIWNEMISTFFDRMMGIKNMRCWNQFIGLRINFAIENDQFEQFDCINVSLYETENLKGLYLAMTDTMRRSLHFPTEQVDQYQLIEAYIQERYVPPMDFDPLVHGPTLIPMFAFLLQKLQTPMSTALMNLKPSQWLFIAPSLPTSSTIDWLSILPQKDISTTWI